MIPKVTRPTGWDFGQEITSLVDVHSRGIDSSWMRKTASASVFKYADLKPRKGHSLVHVIALGDSEYYSGNRNGDLFPESSTTVKAASPVPGGPREFQILRGNKEMHHTFVKNAKVYRHHKHGPQDPSYGDVVDSAHNDDMHRVELLLDLPDNQWEKQLQKIASGKGGPVWSMASRVPFDVCTVCLNKAPTRKQYCEHAKNHLTAITKEGAYVGVVNESPNYFDISDVVVNADRIAHTMCKAASHGGARGAAEEAEDYGLLSDELKLAAAKLAKIEKRVAGHSRSAILGTVPGRVRKEHMDALVDDRDSMGASCAALADKKASLFLPDFFRIALGVNYAEYVHDVKLACRSLPTVFKDHGASLIPFEFTPGILAGRTARAIDDIALDFSLTKSAALARTLAPVQHERVEGDASRGRPEVAEQMLRAYGGYKLAWLERVGALEDENNPLTDFALLQHYCDTAEDGDKHGEP